MAYRNVIDSLGALCLISLVAMPMTESTSATTFMSIVRHPRGRGNLDISLETHEETLDTLKNVDECILAGVNNLNGLRELDITTVRAKESRKKLTERRTPMPAKTTPAGGYICRKDIRS